MQDPIAVLGEAIDAGGRDQGDPMPDPADLVAALTAAGYAITPIATTPTGGGPRTRVITSWVDENSASMNSGAAMPTQGAPFTIKMGADGEPDRDGGRPLRELRTTGLLWLINRVVFHPRGFALYLRVGPDGEVRGWGLQGDGSEVWRFATQATEDRHFAEVEALFASCRSDTTTVAGAQPQPVPGPDGARSLLAVVEAAARGKRTPLPDWHRAVEDAADELDEALHRVHHPDDRARLVGLVGRLAQIWLSVDEVDDVVIAGPGHGDET